LSDNTHDVTMRICAAILLASMVTVAMTKDRKIQAKENETAELKCTAGARIKILKVSYGNGDHCKAKEAKAKVAGVCNGKEMCSVQIGNVLFGDPCSGVEKIGKIRYKCAKKKECTAGRWGSNCQKRCPFNCKDDKCDSGTGACFACRINTYGKDCSKACPGLCRNRICDINSGNCIDGCLLPGQSYGPECLTCNHCQDRLCYYDGACKIGDK